MSTGKVMKRNILNIALLNLIKIKTPGKKPGVLSMRIAKNGKTQLN
jgi:hypothetical protein